jgi:glycosyltransferase involved in cell wall biosynthesis
MRPVCIQINWQRQLGGGEIYTRFFTQALQSLGWDVHLVVDRKADFWSRLGLTGVRYFPIGHGDEIPQLLAAMDPGVVVTHTTLSTDVAQAVAARHRLGGIVHMPLADRDPRGLSCYHRIFAVSAYVRDTVAARGHAQVHAEPLLGVADLKPRESVAGPIIRRSEYDWDKRKFRDRFLSWCAPLDGLRTAQEFARRPGLTLGIVSRLTPIKQFPLLFSHLASVLAGFKDVNLEVFGSGGYASVRDLRAALAPLGERVRFWGHQADPAAIYPLLDYVLSGLPEREALGLNLIEAQACGTPVIAVAAPPFTETVVDGVTGFLYADPRTDGAAGFRRLLESLTRGTPRPDPRLAAEHLAIFSPPAFAQRVARAMKALAP